MFPLEKSWHQVNISLIALKWIRSVKEMETLKGVEGAGMLAGAQQTCPILIMGHGPLTAGKHHDYLNQDKLRVQFTHLNTLCRQQTSIKCY